MNDAQQIFAIFYAIFWGSQFNVIPRWKPFNFGLLFDNEVRHVSGRISLALLIFNIFPIIYFIVIFYILSGQYICENQKKCWISISTMVLSGIIPAFGIFGFYRIWLYIIEKNPRQYYVNNNLIPCKYHPWHGSVHKPEPALEELGIEPSNRIAYWKNGIVGSSYIILGLIGAKLPYAILFIMILTSLYCWLFCKNYSNIISMELITILYLIGIIIILFISFYFGNNIYFFIKELFT